MKHLGLALSSLTLFSVGCASNPIEEPEYDQLQLAQYRAAIPTQAQLEASSMQTAGAKQTDTSSVIGQVAVYPLVTAPMVVAINGTVKLTVAVLKTIVSYPPTAFNLATKEFLWGPFPSDEFGYTAAYIKDVGDSGDFRYEYALLRGASEDLSMLTPIVYGGTSPHASNSDWGVGVTVWDMSADNTFRAANDPNYDAAAPHDTGRFAALFSTGPDAENTSTTISVVVAVFRDFIAKNNQEGVGIDLDYFYGRIQTETERYDFVDLELSADVTKPKDGLAEDIGVRLVFVNGGIGRAEADAINGSLENNQRLEVVECWDSAVKQTYLHGMMNDEGTSTEVISEGEATDCGVFNQSLDAMGVPRLQDVDSELLDALDTVASQ